MKVGLRGSWSGKRCPCQKGWAGYRLLRSCEDVFMANASEISSKDTQRGERLSYKFQRLRERLRDAVRNGELSGKLPGERELARRFKANPKTLSKALTDLAAE